VSNVRRSLLLARDAKSTNLRAHALLSERVGELSEHELQWRELHIERLGEMLVVAGDAQVVVARHHAIGRHELADHQLQQGRLAGSVGSHDRNAAVEVDAEIDLLVQQPGPAAS